MSSSVNERRVGCGRVKSEFAAVVASKDAGGDAHEGAVGDAGVDADVLHVEMLVEVSILVNV